MSGPEDELGCSGDPRRAGERHPRFRNGTAVRNDPLYWYGSSVGTEPAARPSFRKARTVEPRDRTPTRLTEISATATVTVAELVARHGAGTGPAAPDSREAPEPDADVTPTPAMSVAALLRREGTGPRRADGPLLPRGHSRSALASAGASRRNMGKVTTVAVVLFAASAVFGSLFVDNSVRNRAAADDEAGLPDGGGPGGAGQALEAFGVEAVAATAAGAQLGAPVTGVTLASEALSSTRVAEDGDRSSASAGAAGAQPTVGSSEFPIGEASSSAGNEGLPEEGDDAGDPQAEQGAPGNGGSRSGGLAGARGEERGKTKGLENAGSGERGPDR
jgi:hypothetical protein